MTTPEVIRALLGAAIYVQAIAALVWAAVWYLIDAGRRVLEDRVSTLERKNAQLERLLEEWQAATVEAVGASERKIHRLADLVHGLRVRAGWLDDDPEQPTFAQWQCPGCRQFFDLPDCDFHSRCSRCGSTLELVTFGANEDWNICVTPDQRSTKLQR
jgi:uncharacterized coiled-coil protein SlyX